MATVMFISLIIAGIGLFLFPLIEGEDWDWIIPVGMWVILMIDGILALLDLIFGIF